MISDFANRRRRRRPGFLKHAIDIQAASNAFSPQNGGWR